MKKQYLRLLEGWIKSAVSDIYTCPDRPDLIYYGDGTNGWGVQTNQKGLSAFAVLASEPDLDERAVGVSRTQLLKYALGMLRYSLASHKSGDYHTTDADNFKWGHTWISALGVERMMHAVEAIYDKLNGNDLRMLRSMLVSESDWLLDNYPVTAGLIQNNKPESNMWNGSVMLRTAMMYPDTPRANEYIEKAKVFFANAISVPSDEFCEEVVDGKPVKDYFVGANFFESYGCNHHGYMNVGYMVITLSNLAMMHFSCRHFDYTPPKLLYRNFEKLWQLVRACIFDDGRLNRIGGDTRVRYCYCQDYLIPVLMMAADCGLTDAAEIARLEKGWLDIVKTEVAHNGDGTFLSDRCELLREKSPLYFTRLESDRAVSLSYGVYWHRLYGDFTAKADYPYSPDQKCREMLRQWHDEYHGSCYIRGDKRYASFTWVGAELPTGLCLPPEDSSLAEWKYNMTGEIFGDGFTDSHKLLRHREHMYDGGFATCGTYLSHTDGLIAEQLNEEDTAVCYIAYAALPDDATVVTLQYAVAPKRVHLNKVKSFKLNIPNDIFNGGVRDYVISDDGRQITVDGRLHIRSIYGKTLKLYKPHFRQIGIKYRCPYPERGMLHCDEICETLQLSPTWYEKDDCIYDFGIAVTCGSETPAENFVRCDLGEGLLRAVVVNDTNGIKYIVAASFADEPCSTELCGKTVELEAYDCVIIEL